MDNIDYKKRLLNTLEEYANLYFKYDYKLVGKSKWSSEYDSIVDSRYNFIKAIDCICEVLNITNQPLDTLEPIRNVESVVEQNGYAISYIQDTTKEGPKKIAIRAAI